jgi:DNA-binding CsgD family transcriptional regulator
MSTPTQPRRFPSYGTPLTAGELQVLRGMSEGKTNADIGRELHLAEDTIKTRARSLFRKLGARDRSHAVAIGFQHGLLTAQDPATPIATLTHRITCPASRPAPCTCRPAQGRTA